jgi:signal transduction histidine kinase
VISWIDMVNFAFAVCGMLVTLLGLFMSRSVTHLDRWARLFFRAVFSIALAYTDSDLVSQISLLFLGPQYRLLSAAAVFGESLLSSLLMPLMTLYLLYSLKKPWRKSLSFRLAVFLWGVYLILLVVNLFVPEFYVITGQNVYQRKPLYPVLLVPPILLMSVNLFVLFRNWKVFTRRQRQAFASYLLIPLICMLLQSLAYGLLMIVIGTSAAVMLMFIFILRDQFEQYLLQKEENTRQRNSIMVLQMRPHFIYNTMTSIYYLCKQDSDKAQQVILDFTSYLRSNFTAVAREDTVPFPEEMEHTRAYLAVEQVRFEGKLSVEFDTPYTSFRIPPLTLQPIVENAVKHGVDPDMDPLHITVRTRKSSHGNEIIVEDNGPGFGPSDNADPHIALNNIRERLKIMCNGSLHISAREGGGTVVTIVV